jgi:uncharacterized OB-fold protein
VLAIVALDEGPRLTTNVVDTNGEDLVVGQRVVPMFDRLDDEHVLSAIACPSHPTGFYRAVSS